jgi:hypothetical protein
LGSFKAALLRQQNRKLEATSSGTVDDGTVKSEGILRAAKDSGVFRRRDAFRGIYENKTIPVVIHRQRSKPGNAFGRAGLPT